MKKHKRIFKKRGFMAKCPNSGGYCLNPMCALGCIEELF